MTFTDLLPQYNCINSVIAVHGGGGHEKDHVCWWWDGITLERVRTSSSAALLDTGVPGYLRLMDRELDWICRI